MVLVSLGDIDEILEEVTPSDDFVKNADLYRKRNAKYMSISIAMYIVSAAVLISFFGFGEFTQYEDIFMYIGLLLFLFIVAAATGMIVYIQYSTPLEYKDYNRGKKNQYRLSNNRKSRVQEAIHSGFWAFVVASYLLISFLTGRWDIIWILFIIAASAGSLIDAVFEWREHE